MRLMLAAIILAHSWYDPQCCSGTDCEPLAHAPELRGDDFVLPNGALFARSSVRQSHDGSWHWCHREFPQENLKIVYCVYEPLSS